MKLPGTIGRGRGRAGVTRAAEVAHGVLEHAGPHVIEGIDHVLARLGLARLSRISITQPSQQQHVDELREITRRRAKTYEDVNLLSTKGAARLESSGISAQAYVEQLKGVMKSAENPKRKLVELEILGAFDIIKSVDLWYCERPQDPKAFETPEAIYSAVEQTFSLEKRDRQPNHAGAGYIFTSPENGFATLRRIDVMARFTHGEGAATRRGSLKQVVTASVTEEFAGYFVGDMGPMERGRRILQPMLDGNIPPVQVVDILYYLVFDDDET